MSEQKIRVGITLGDVNGIGPEIVVKIFSDAMMSDLCTPVIYGPSKALAHYKKTLPGTDMFQYTSIGRASEARGKRINAIDCAGDVAFEPGTPSEAAGKAAVEALRMAVKDLREGGIDVLVTGPFCKETVQSEEFDFKGHTEFLERELGGKATMMMCSDAMRVALQTIHLPLSEVSGAITADGIVSSLERLRKTLKEDFAVVEPRMAVLGLNPHAGDGGFLGSEEKDIIRPAIEQAATKGILAFGPFAADGFFASMGHEKYDAVLAMYHDQGLAPFKALTPEGVNFTAGLDFVRTSPDHGTAYDIAGKGVADPASMRNAIYLAIDILRNRRRYAEMSANPLQHYERERSHKDLSVKDLIPETEQED